MLPGSNAGYACPIEFGEGNEIQAPSFEENSAFSSNNKKHLEVVLEKFVLRRKEGRGSTSGTYLLKGMMQAT